MTSEERAAVRAARQKGANDDDIKTLLELMRAEAEHEPVSEPVPSTSYPEET